jgi:hypothetical protein
VSSLRVGSTLALCAALAAWSGASACGRLGYDSLAFVGDGGPDVADAATTPGTPDAPSGTPDATTDATPGTPDAPPAPDAAAGTPDAGWGGGTDTGEIALTTDTADSDDPAIAFTGDGYSVIWSDSRHGTGNREIYLQRVVAAGALAGGNLRLTSASGYSGYPGIAWSGTELAIAWEDSRLVSHDEVYFARFDKAGGAISQQVPLSNAFGRAYDPWPVWNGSVFAIAWEDGSSSSGSDIYFSTVDPGALNPGTPVRRTNVAGSSVLPVAAWTGSAYGLAWEDTRSGQSEVYFARSGATGAALGIDPPAISSTSDSGQAFYPSLAWNGSTFGIAYEDSRTGTFLIYVTFLLADGTRVGPDVPISSGGTATEATIVWAGDHWAISYMQARQIFIVELNGVLLPGAPRAVSSASGNATSPRMVWSGDAYGVTWQDRRAGNWDIYFREVLP